MSEEDQRPRVYREIKEGVCPPICAYLFGIGIIGLIIFYIIMMIIRG